jgi:methionyl-tRNA synthetase
MTLLDQTCPHCQITEAMGGYCTACERPTLPEWTHPPKRSPRQRATAERFAATRRKESPHASKGQAA